MSRSCVVVGAGPAGLTAAYRLANAGVRVVVLEAAPHIGGRTRTEHVGGCVVNTGAGFIANFFSATVPLLRELGLRLVNPRPQAGVAATAYGKFPLDLGSVRGVLRFPLVRWIGKLRAGVLPARTLVGRRAHVADVAALARYDRGQTLEQWARRWAGDPAYQYLVRPAVETFFYFGCEEASAALGRALVRHGFRWQMQIIANGTGAFCDALAQRLEVRTGCRVGSVEVGSERIAVRHAGGTVEADYAILAIPASAAAHVEGALLEADRDDLRGVRYAPNIVLFFGYERPITVQYPSVVPSGPGRHPVASVATTSRWVSDYVPEGKELVAIHASAWRSAELLEREPDKIVTALRADAEEIFGRLADPDWIRMYPRAEAMVVPSPGHYRRMRAFLRRPRQRLLFAGDWLTGSTIEGAVRTGLAAAQRILGAQQS